jgi:hypothetical protein
MEFGMDKYKVGLVAKYQNMIELIFRYVNVVLKN